jgi:hypothetical protein
MGDMIDGAERNQESGIRIQGWARNELIPDT